MNYVIEDGMDFFAELAKDDNKESEQKDDNVHEEGGIDKPEVGECLLSGEPLARNNITLRCNHKFNYCPLFHEVVRQKTIYNPNDTSRLMLNEIKCPYCRQITPQILPYIPCEHGISKIKGVNDPKILCLDHKQCTWMFKSGKKKGELCGGTGFDTDHGTYCTKHWGKILLNASKHEENIEEPTLWTTEMEEAFREHTVVSLKEKLRAKSLKLSGCKKDLVMRLLSYK